MNFKNNQEIMKILSNLDYKEKEKIVRILEKQLKESVLKRINKLPDKNKEELIKILSEQIEESKYDIPIEIFNKKLSSLEGIVKYLKEMGLSYSDIAKLIKRDQRTIWKTYNNAIKKQKSIFSFDTIAKNRIFIPIKILKNRNLSVLENIVSYLKDSRHLSYNEISLLLKRKYPTIVTVYNRSIKKRK